MTRDQAMLLAVGGLGVLCLVLLAVVLRLRASGARVRTEVDVLRERLERLEARDRADSPVREAAGAGMPEQVPAEFVITDLGTRVEPDPEPVHLGGATFADIVAKEAVVKAASLVSGLRRGLAPETRHRIRFEMRQEVRRSRKQRRADVKTARRDLHAAQRAGLAVDSGEVS